MDEPTRTQDGAAEAWPGAIGAITLFVEDLSAAKRFYADVPRRRDMGPYETF